MLNNEIHINEEGNLIPKEQQEYIWLGNLIGSRKLKNVALATDAAMVTSVDPYAAAYDTLSALKKAVSNNFVPAFTVLGAVCMGIHYEKVLEDYGMCPTPVAIAHGEVDCCTHSTVHVWDATIFCARLHFHCTHHVEQ